MENDINSITDINQLKVMAFDESEVLSASQQRLQAIAKRINDLKQQQSNGGGNES
jgi:hypothetical protein